MFRSNTVLSVVWCLFWLSGCGGTALESPVDIPVTSYFTVFTEYEGLASLTVTDVAVDYIRGGAWFSTRKGVSYCGFADSLVYTVGPEETGIPSLKGTAVAVDFTGTVWIGTESGVGTLEISDSSWSALSDMDVLAHRYVNSITVLNDFSIWFGTRGGASVLAATGQWTSFIGELGISFEVNDIAPGPADAVIWLGSTNGIAVSTAGHWSFIAGSTLPSPQVNALYRDSSGVLWCGTTSIAASYDGNAWVRYGTADGLTASGINDFAQDSTGRLWAATNTGVFFLNAGNSGWEQLELPDAVEGAIVHAVACDHVQSILWMATSRGVVRYTL